MLTTTEIYTKSTEFVGLVATNSSHMSEPWQQDRNGNKTNLWHRSRKPAETLARIASRGRAGAGQRALMRVARRDSLRATVFLCRTPLVVARCSSGWASWKADWAAALSPVSIAALDLLDKGAHPAQPGTIDDRALFGLAKPFFGGFMMRHAIRWKRESGLISMPEPSVNRAVSPPRGRPAVTQPIA